MDPPDTGHRVLFSHHLSREDCDSSHGCMSGLPLKIPAEAIETAGMKNKNAATHIPACRLVTTTRHTQISARSGPAVLVFSVEIPTPTTLFVTILQPEWSRFQGPP